jgi:enediyne biosynthesis protein E4
MNRPLAKLALLPIGVILLVNQAAPQSSPQSPPAITFHDIAAGDNAGISYRRVPSPRLDIFNQIAAQPFFIHPQDFFATPIKPHGSPGVVLFDYNNDGCLDIFVTNGPGRGNSLYKNMLCETGELRFVDVAQQAGVAAIDRDNQGACAGDINNDGFMDLYVTGNQGSLLFKNMGDGTFIDITDKSGTGNGSNTGTGCSMADVNGDGLLDIVVANSYHSWDNKQVYAGDPFPFTESNELFLNQGNDIFVPAEESSGFSKLAGLPEGSSMLTWAIAAVDLFQNGSVDIVTADDQTVLAPAVNGGQDVGFVRVARNDGTGHFRDVTFDANLNHMGAWMGLAFGDFNCDGHLDIFATNMGNYVAGLVGAPFSGPDWSSRWFFGQPDGSFLDPGVGALKATPFGWGTGVLDFNNDGDQDIVFYGGFDFTEFIDKSNAGTLLENHNCSGNFTRNTSALARGASSRRGVDGLAVGDLNNDGFDDIVSVSDFDVPTQTPLIQYPDLFASPFDVDADFVPMFFPTSVPGELKFSSFQLVDGTLAVEINSANNGNRSIQVTTKGTKGITNQGRVNRDGIGAVVKVTPQSGRSVLRPVVAGDSHGSQSSLRGTFGLADARSATVEILWPGGTRNRLYEVQSGERILFPEIPCSFDAALTRRAYVACVGQALDELRAAGIVDGQQSARFFSSAIRAFDHRDVH